MSITGLKLSQISANTDAIKSSDFFYYVTESAGPVYESRKAAFDKLTEFVDETVGDVVRSEFIAADTVLKDLLEAQIEKERIERITDVDKEETDRIAAVAQEKVERVAEDVVLTQKIKDEQDARISAIQQEATLRMNADNAEAAARNAADAEILEALATEVTQRGSSDTAITTALANEVSARATAEAALTKAIADEGSARVASDASLIDALTEEEVARIAAVAALQASLTNESTVRSAAITTLTTSLATEKEARIDADAEEAVARAEAISVETTARTAADQVLTTALSTEVTNRLSAIAAEKSARESAISTEKSARESAISTEKLERIAGDQSNLTAFNTALEEEAATRTLADETEQSARIAADNSLAASVQAEANARIAAISAEELARIASVSAEETARISAINVVATQVSGIEGKLPLKADLLDGKIPSSQLPAYVDDVLEFSLLEDLPIDGEPGKIYVVKFNNLTYRWSGTSYVEISQSLALGETSATAYRGDLGKLAFDHTLIIDENPHGTTKDHVGLGNADNTSDIDKPVSEATQLALDLKADISFVEEKLETKISIEPVPFHSVAGDYGTVSTTVALTSNSADVVTDSVLLENLPNSSNVFVKERRLVSNLTTNTLTEIKNESVLRVDATGAITTTTGDAVVEGTTLTISFTGEESVEFKVLSFITIEWLAD